MGAVLVTGGAGFVGRAVIERLTRQGHGVVSFNRDYSEPSPGGPTLVQGELFDLPRLVRTLRNHDVRQVVHTAAVSHPTLSLDFPVATFAANVEGTLSVFEACRLADVERVVNFSSETVYGHLLADPVDESRPVHPTTPYAVTKLATEWLGSIYTTRYGLDVVSLRVTQVYGPGNRMPEIIGDILRTVVRGQRFELEHGADHSFNLIHVDDVAHAVSCALAAPPAPRELAYNISSAEYWALRDAIDLIRQAIPQAEVHLGPGLIPELDLQGPFSCAAAQRDLSYEPRWGLAEGIQDYIAWLSTHPY